MKMICGLALSLLLLQTTPDKVDKPDAEKLRSDLVGTWEVVTPDLPEGLRDLKHITPTHFTWVIYSKGEMSPVGSAGGTWSLEGNQYKERCEFASQGWEHLRGKEATFTIKIEGEKLLQGGVLDTGFKVNEV